MHSTLKQRTPASGKFTDMMMSPQSYQSVRNPRPLEPVYEQSSFFDNMISPVKSEKFHQQDDPMHRDHFELLSTNYEHNLTKKLMAEYLIEII